MGHGIFPWQECSLFIFYRQGLGVSMKKALFFDFWGTLWSPHSDPESLKLILQEAKNVGVVLKDKEGMGAMEQLGGLPRAGIWQCLGTIQKKFLLFMVSHSSPFFLQEACQQWGIDRYFCQIASTHSHGMDKARAILYLEEVHGVRIGFYVGDNFSDALVAKLFKCPYLHMGREKVKGSIRNFEDLHALEHYFLKFSENENIFF
jgi:FMN phosphatase YigB (HAD superfamily)